MNIKVIADKELGGYVINDDVISICTCPFCKDEEYNFIYREVAQTYVCKKCNEFGTASKLSKHLNIQEEIDKAEVPSVKFNYDNIKKLDILECDNNLLGLFKGFNIYEDTLEKAKMFVTKGFENTLNIVASDEKNNVKFIKLLSFTNGVFKVEDKSNSPNYLWGVNDVSDDRIIITNTLVNRLALMQNNINNVVSVMNENDLLWIKECYNYLESKSQILLLFDKEYASKYQEEIMMRLGKFKVFTLEHGYKNVLDIHINKDTDVFDSIRGNKFCVEIENLVAFNAIKIKDKAKPINLQDKVCNAMLAGGNEGELTIWSGLPGAGKTTVLNQLLCNLADARTRCMVYSGEFLPQTLKQKLQETIAGKEYLIVKKNEFDPNLMERSVVSLDVENAIDDYIGDMIDIYEYDMMAKGEELIKAIERSYKQKGTKVFVLDNLMTIWLDINENNKLEKQTEFVMKLKALCKNYPIHIFLVAHPKKVDNPKDITMFDIAGTSNIPNLADNIVFLRRLEEKEISKVLEDNTCMARPTIAMKLLKDRKYGRIGYTQYMSYDKGTGRVHSIVESPYWQYGFKGFYDKKKIAHSN